MKKIIYVYGLPATGKTTICSIVSEVLFKEKQRVFYIPCDQIALFAVRCGYSAAELDIKYKNLISILDNIMIMAQDCIIIVDDNFKRNEDVLKVYNYVKEKTDKYVFINTYLSAGVEEAIARNSSRAAYAAMPEIRLRKYYVEYADIHVPVKISLETSGNIMNCVEEVLYLIRDNS